MMEGMKLLSDSRIAILGLGLMGGSLGLALRGRCGQIIGIDPDKDVLARAHEIQLCDFLSPSADSHFLEANFIVLAAPVEVIISVIHDLPNIYGGHAVVLDIGSTKVEITRAMRSLPARFEPIGGHPMCGKEQLSIMNASPELYIGATFALTALPNTTPRAANLVEQLVRAIGANPLWIDPETHDKWVAMTSHLPYLLASTLVMATSSEVIPLIGPGFRSATRLAATPPSMMSGILETNQANILEALGRYKEQLSVIEELIKKGSGNELKSFLSLCATRQKELFGSNQQRIEI